MNTVITPRETKSEKMKRMSKVEVKGGVCRVEKRYRSVDGGWTGGILLHHERRTIKSVVTCTLCDKY
mgnify:CR=1 FL=1